MNEMDRDNSGDVLYKTRFLELKKTLSPSGKSDWYYANRPNNGSDQDAVAILPILHDDDGDRVIFLKTKRVPLIAEGKGVGCIELPAGLVADEREDETLEEAIKKELLEETGYVASDIRVVNSCIASSPGCLSETFAIAVADIYDKTIVKEPVTDGGVIEERIEVLVEDIDTFMKQASDEGYIVSGHALVGLYYIK